LQRLTRSGGMGQQNNIRYPVMGEADDLSLRPSNGSIRSYKPSGAFKLAHTNRISAIFPCCERRFAHQSFQIGPNEPLSRICQSLPIHAGINRLTLCMDFENGFPIFGVWRSQIDLAIKSS
jgi:hypothetical protein